MAMGSPLRTTAAGLLPESPGARTRLAARQRSYIGGTSVWRRAKGASHTDCSLVCCAASCKQRDRTIETSERATCKSSANSLLAGSHVVRRSALRERRRSHLLADETWLS